jgi:hypothetical protein
MNDGEEHYRQAQKLLETKGPDETAQDAANRLAEAQVHATLALAAATIAASEAQVRAMHSLAAATVAAQSGTTDDRRARNTATAEPQPAAMEAARRSEEERLERWKEISDQRITATPPPE